MFNLCRRMDPGCLDFSTSVILFHESRKGRAVNYCEMRLLVALFLNIRRPLCCDHFVPTVSSESKTPLIRSVGFKNRFLS